MSNIKEFYIKKSNNVNLIDIEPLINENVTIITLESCKIRNIPENFFIKFKKLESLVLKDNYLEEIDFYLPENLTYLDISFNKINGLKEKYINNKLEYLDISYNFLKFVPKFIDDLEIVIYTKENNFDTKKFLIIESNKQRKIEIDINDEKINNGRPVNNIIRNKNKNVHETQIQENTRKSIDFLINNTGRETNYNPDYIDEIIKARKKQKLTYKNYFLDFLFNFQELISYTKFKTLLKLYDSITDSRIIYDYEKDRDCKISDIIERIWHLSKDHQDLDSILENLYTQIDDGKLTCFVGKYTRLLNTIYSFDLGVKNKLAFNDLFNNEIERLRKSKLTTEQLQKSAKVFINDSEETLDEKKIWLDAIEYLE